MREEREIMRSQREKLVKSILDELEELIYNKKNSSYKGKVKNLPQITSKESRITEVVTGFQSKENLVHSIRNAAEKISRTSLGGTTHFSPLIEDIMEAFSMHYKIINEQANSKSIPIPRTKTDGKNIQIHEEANNVNKVNPKHPHGTEFGLIKEQFISVIIAKIIGRRISN